MKTVTVAQFLDAMEKNGWEKIKETYVAYSDNALAIPIGACAYGQAALNLGVDPGDLHQAVVDTVPNVFTNILGDNDHTEMTVPEIARKYRKIAENLEILDLEIEVLE